MPVAFDADRDAVLAVDIDGSAIEAGIVTPSGSLIDRSRITPEVDVGPQSHFSSVAAVVTEQLDRSRQHGRRIKAVGVGCEGPIDRNCVTVSPVGLDSWRRFQLRDHLAELTGLPVYGDLDAKALALSEGWLGAAQGVSSFATITVSSGVGGGLVLDGQLLDGATGNAGHFGHVIVEPGGRRCRCGARGCLDAEASGLAIETITGRSPREPTYDIMRRTGTLVGRAAGGICAALDLDVVVIGGSVALGFAATFFNAAQEEVDEVARIGQGPAARVTQVRLGDRGALVGAGAVAIRGVRRSARDADDGPS